MIRFILLVIFSVSVNCETSLETVLEWKQVTFAWKDQHQKADYVKQGLYNAENILPVSIQKWNNKLFIPVPRMKLGVASTFNYVDLNSTDKSPAYIPYPSWEVNKIPKRKGRKGRTGFTKYDSITSVMRVKVDVCDRLWVIDMGVVNVFGDGQHLNNPTLRIYDLKTDELIRKYELKKHQYFPGSTFSNIDVDVDPDNCDKAFAYMPDLGSNGLVVYNFEENDSWRVEHHFFSFDPVMGDFYIHGINFQWKDGIFSTALSKKNEDGYRTLYFHAFASNKEFSVSTEVLRNKTLALSPFNYHLFKFVGEKGPKTQSSAMVIDRERGVIFFTQVQKNGVACWNVNKPLNPENFHLLLQDDEKLHYTNDFFIEDGYLWIFANKMSQFVFSRLNPEEVNFRVMKIKIDDIIKGTPCAP